MANGTPSCEQDHEVVSGSIFFRRVSLPKAGDVLQGHKHHFDHTTFVVAGSVTFRKPGEMVTLHPGDHLLIDKDIEHEATAETDGVVYVCIYSHYSPQGEHTLEYTGWMGGYAAREANEPVKTRAA